MACRKGPDNYLSHIIGVNDNTTVRYGRWPMYFVLKRLAMMFREDEEEGAEHKMTQANVHALLDAGCSSRSLMFVVNHCFNTLTMAVPFGDFGRSACVKDGKGLGTGSTARIQAKMTSQSRISCQWKPVRRGPNRLCSLQVITTRHDMC